MAARIIKNLTGDDAELGDLGGIVVPASGQIDLVGDHGLSLVELAESEDLCDLVAQGTDNFVFNDGEMDYSDKWLAIDVIRRIEQRTLKSKDGRSVVRADSRIQGYKLYFCQRGDTATGIGDGKWMTWDFSVPDDGNTDITEGVPSGFKRKRIEFSFSQSIQIKEGTIYFFDGTKGSYLDLYVVCPSGGYYPHPYGPIDGSVVGVPGVMFAQATEDTVVDHFVTGQGFQGDCPMGDELNTEGATENAILHSYKYWIDVTVPDSDTSNGRVGLEIYRPNTCILPGCTITDGVMVESA